MKTTKIKSNSLNSNGLRLDASLYLSEGIQLLSLLSSSLIKVKPLHEVTSNIFYGGRSRRIYVANPKNGIPFIKGADITKSSFSSLKLISRKRTKDLQSYALKEGWTLITRSGSIGNTAFVNKDFIDKAASDDIIRVCPKDIPDGFLYAYLSSKYGNLLLTQNKYGAVIQHIEPEHITNIPVPIFSESKQKEIHNLIVESANLRVEANRLLEEAETILADNINYINFDNTQYNCVSSNLIRNSFTKRFEANYYIDEGEKIANYIKNNMNYKLLREVTSDIFRPGIFKRVYVNKGITFLGGSDIVKRIPSGEKQLSYAKTKNIKSLMVEKGWILVTCGGTIGNSIFVDSEIAKCAASQHILRLIPKYIPAGYLFTFINSSLGKKIIQRYTYGSVIPQIEPSHIEHIPIPLLNSDQIENINKLAMDSITKNETSKKKELEAIQSVEKEIESWQQS